MCVQVDGCTFDVPEHWGRIAIHVDNFLFAEWSSTLHERFAAWVRKVPGLVLGCFKNTCSCINDL